MLLETEFFEGCAGISAPLSGAANRDTTMEHSQLENQMTYNT